MFRTRKRKPNENELLRTVLAVALIVGLSSACDDTKQPKMSVHSNVLVIVIDSLRPDHVGQYGYGRNTTPAIDQLAREGARFENAFAPTSASLAALTTLLTSLPPEQHGLVSPDKGLHPAVLTAPEVFAARGFATAGFVPGPGLDKGRGLSQGFETYVEQPVDVKTGRSDLQLEALRTRASEWLASWHEERTEEPFLLFVQLPRVDFERVPPAPFAGMFLDGNAEATPLERAIARYDEGIRLADDAVGKLVAQIDAMGVREKTLVVVTSNHGYEFMERGTIGSATSLHDESIHIPMIVRFPTRVDAGKVVSEPARLMDVGSTLMMFARVRRPLEFGFSHEAYGIAMRDLTELIVGEPQGRPVLVTGDLPGKSQSLQLGSYKLIRNLARGGTEPGSSSHQLFNVEEDPLEQEDLSDVDPKRTAVLSKKLSAWREICAARPGFAGPYPVANP